MIGVPIRRKVNTAQRAFPVCGFPESKAQSLGGEATFHLRFHSIHTENCFSVVSRVCLMWDEMSIKKEEARSRVGLRACEKRMVLVLGGLH